MKKKLNLFCFFAVLLLLTPKIHAQCTSGTKYPAGIYQATTEAGASTINTDARTGQYADVHVLPSKQYTFTSSVATDYITVTNDTGTQVYASGLTPLDYVTVYNQTVRYYIHQNAQCGTSDQFVRTRRLSWRVAPPCLDPVPTGVTNISPISCNINYTEPSTAPYFGYEAYVSTSSATPGLTVPIAATSRTNSLFVTGLNPDTTYHYWLRADCLYQKGGWIYGGTFSTISALVCNGAYYGLHPSTTFTPSCTGSFELFTEQTSRNGTYSNIAVVPNTQYSFRTSYPNDFLTITNALGTAVFTSGIDEVSWNSGGYSGVIRFYSHDNAQCGYGMTSTTLRSKSVKCVTTSATCLPPTSLAISNITSNSVRMGWTAPATAPSGGYEIYMATTNTAPGVTTTATFTSANAGLDVVSGLTAGVTYYYWIRSNCGTDKSTWASGGSFTANASLLCNSATNGLFPNATFTPSCTGAAEQIASEAWASEYSNINIVSNRQYTFTSSIATDYITITNAAGTAVLANGVTPLNWSSGTTAGVVRYYLHSNANCGAQNTNRIKSIRCTSASTTCGLPTALAVSNITSNSCRMTWNAPASAPTSYDIYIITSNTAPTANTTASASSNNAGVGVLNGIDAATTYYYWIRSNCNGTKSDWVSGGSFTTNAALNCNGATHGLYPNATFTPACTGSAEQIVDNAWAGEYSNVNISSNKQYTFTSSVATDYITITNTAGTQVLASGLTPLNWNSNSTSGVIRFHINANANCGTQNTARVRSIKCANAAAACNAPTQFWSEAVTSTTATLSWIPSTPAPNGGYLYVYNTSPTIGGMDGSSSSTNAYLSNLLPSTTYYWWVAANCGSSQSTWVLGGSFTTLAGTATCNAPTQFWSEAVTSTTATLSWIPSTSAPNGGYLYVYNTSPTVGGMDGSSSSTNAYLSNLLPSTTYYWWVAANCVSSQSPWVLGGSFTTLPAASSGCWQSITTGLSHTVGIRPDGSLWAWGSNDFGQLGDGTRTARTTPVRIGTANDWQSVSAGTSYTMAIKTNGTLWGWGYNGNSRLGDDTTNDRIYPAQVGTATNWQSVCAGDVNTFAIKTNGTLWAWGYNGYGQLGDGTFNSKTTPFQIGTATNWQSVDVGNLHTIATKTNGTLWAWGTNTDGQVGDGTTAVRFSPVQIGTETNWKSVAAGANHSVALKTNGVLFTWGHNLWGQLGDNTNISKSTPTPVYDQVQTIGAGANHTVGTTAFGNRFYTGINSAGQLGNGTTENRNSVQVSNSNNHRMIVAGYQHTISLNTDGSISACGSNGQSQFGNGTTANSTTMVAIACPNNLNVDDSYKTANAVKVYPNPVKDILSITALEDLKTVSVFNLLGQEVMTKSLLSKEGKLDFSSLPSGTYVVKVAAENWTQTLKVIKQ